VISDVAYISNAKLYTRYAQLIPIQRVQKMRSVLNKTIRHAI